MASQGGGGGSSRRRFSYQEPKKTTDANGAASLARKSVSISRPPMYDFDLSLLTSN